MMDAAVALQWLQEASLASVYSACTRSDSHWRLVQDPSPHTRPLICTVRPLCPCKI